RHEPGAEEVLATPVRTGGVEIAHPGRPCGIEHAVRPFLHCGDVVVALQVIGVAEVDVPRAAERGETEADARDDETSVTQATMFHRSSPARVGGEVKTVRRAGPIPDRPGRPATATGSERGWADSG